MTDCSCRYSAPQDASGPRLKALRRQLGLSSQAQLADLLACSRVSVARWESHGLAGEPPLLLRAALLALEAGILPQPTATPGRWGWAAALLTALHQHEHPSTPPAPPACPTGDRLRALIRQLDQEHTGGRNRLPIFVLRAALPAVPRQDLDHALYGLVGHGLRLSTLQEAHLYTTAQYAAGIPTAMGGPKFFLVLEEGHATAASRGETAA
jgi:transcriptional regulator with XRE-family HTH domain